MVIQGDKLLIEGYYHNNGYIKAKVLDVKTTLYQDGEKEDLKNMIIDFCIEEGDQYTYEGINFVGNTKFTDSEFYRHVTQKSGDIYNKSEFDNNFESIKELYYDTGYFFNIYSNDIYEENGKIFHTISIIEGPIAYIGKISFSGNNKTKDVVLKGSIKIEEGDVFSMKELRRSCNNLMNTGFFTAVELIPSANDEGNIDIHYKVTEADSLIQ